MFLTPFESHQFYTSQQTATVFLRCVRLPTRGSGCRNLCSPAPWLPVREERQTREKLSGGGLTWVHLGTRRLGFGKGTQVEKDRNYSTKCGDSSVVDPEDATVRGRDRHCEGVCGHQNVEVSTLLALKFGLNPKTSLQKITLGIAQGLAWKG